MKAKTILFICSTITLSLIARKAHSQRLTTADTTKLLCQKWIAVSRTINGQVFPIDDSPVPLNKRREKPIIDTSNFFQFDEDKTFSCGGLWGNQNTAKWQYLSTNSMVELFDKYGKTAFKLERIDSTHLSLASHAVVTNFETQK